MPTTPHVDLELATLGHEGEALLRRGRELLADAPDEQVRRQAARLPATLTGTDSPPRLVFVGQYSAGKSSLIRVLTGREDIAVGAAITTDLATTYPWSGVEVIDTPGIHTELRPDHDATSYEAIAAADLLVFVITANLMDDHIAGHFRSLAIERDKGREMMLVVNKMQLVGNTPEKRRIKTDDLRRVLAPLRPEDVRLCFIDAELAWDSQREADPAAAADDWRDSGLPDFTAALDAFVREKGTAGRFTTGLYQLEQALIDAQAAVTTGDPAADGVGELLAQKRRALVDFRGRSARIIHDNAHRTGRKIKEAGRAVADAVQDDADPEDVEQSLHEAQALVTRHADEAGQLIQAAIADELRGLENVIEGLAGSDLANRIAPLLTARASKVAETIEVDPERLRKAGKAAKVADQLGRWLLKQSYNPGKSTVGGLFKLRRYSGTATHDFIKAGGKLFGKSFKPWEAARWTRTAANIGRVFTVVGTLASVLIQIKADVDQRKRERQLVESRAEIRHGFGEAADEVIGHFESAGQALLTGEVEPELAYVDAQLADLRATREQASQTLVELGALLDATRALIRRIHDATSARSAA